MTPTSIVHDLYMQFDHSANTKPQIRLTSDISESDQTTEPSSNLQSNLAGAAIIPHKHQRITSLVLGARQVQDNGSVSGQTAPYLPRAPSLFRDTFDDSSIRASYEPSPLSRIAYTVYSTRPTTRRQASHYLPKRGVKALKMPHAVSIANTGFQAIILCGPGIGLSTFTNVPQEYPKALVPIANRPMIWYALDLCYRMGVTDITIVTPPASKAPIEAALAQNPDLTALPSPKPDLLAPADLEFNTPTAELLRLPEIQNVIKSDFVLLPCDLICDLPGDSLLEAYLTNMAGMAGTGADLGSDARLFKSRNKFALGAEGSGRRGGLSFWYNTANRAESVKKEECDFMGTVSVDSRHEVPLQKITDMPEGRMQKLVWTTPMSELLEEAEENKALKVRQSLLRKYGVVKCLTKYRDSHLYFLPHWVKDFAKQNEDFESISEDLLGSWAKSEWRDSSFRAARGANSIFKRQRTASMSGEDTSRQELSIEDELDLMSLSSTQVTQHAPRTASKSEQSTLQLASRVQPANPEDSMISTTTDESAVDEGDSNISAHVPDLPPILAYVLSSKPDAPLVRRVDTTPLLLSVSLLLAKLPPVDQPDASPFSHVSKIHSTSQPASTVRVTVSTTDSLIAMNTTLNQHCSIKQSCIGSGCTIGAGARIQGCVIMDGAEIGEKAVLSGTVIGKKAKIAKGVKLTDCEVQDAMHVPEETEAKNEKFLVGGFEDGDDGLMGDAGDGEY